MKITFFSPSFHTMNPHWQEHPQTVKLAVPMLAGRLNEKGYKDIDHFDFENQGFNKIAEEPNYIDFSCFFNQTQVQLFLDSYEYHIEQQLHRFLNLFEVQESKLFCFSCASVLGHGELAYDKMMAMAHFNVCLAKSLKQLYPESRTVLGGMLLLPYTDLVHAYRSLLKQSNGLDYAVFGKGEEVLCAIADHSNNHTNWEQTRISYEKINSGMLLYGTPTYGYPDFIVSSNRSFTGNKKTDISNTNHNTLFPTPYFDKKNSIHHDTTSKTILKRNHLYYYLYDDFFGINKNNHDANHTVVPLIFQEGCTNHCAFCIFGTIPIKRLEVKHVIKNLAYLRETYGSRNFLFLNTNINSDYEYATQFCQELIAAKLDIWWSDCANFKQVDEYLLDLFKESGGISFAWGVESPSDRLLSYVHKGITQSEIKQKLKHAHDLGIWNHILLITGIPTEQESDILQTLAFLDDTKDWVDGYTVTPFYLPPGSQMARYPENYNIDLVSNSSRCIEHIQFDERNGNSWEEITLQKQKTTERLREAIKQIKGEYRYLYEPLDQELFYLLYNHYGHSGKNKIRRILQHSFIQNATDLAKYCPTVESILNNPPVFVRNLFPFSIKNFAFSTPYIDENYITFSINDGYYKYEVRIAIISTLSDLSMLLENHDIIFKGHHLVALVNRIPNYVNFLKEILDKESEFSQKLRNASWIVSPTLIKDNKGGYGFRLSYKTYKIDYKIDLFFDLDENTNEKMQDTNSIDRIYTYEKSYIFRYTFPNNTENCMNQKEYRNFIYNIAHYILLEFKKNAKKIKHSIPEMSIHELKKYGKALIHLLEE